jgi:hypothetical protein
MWQHNLNVLVNYVGKGNVISAGIGQQVDDDPSID